MSPFANDIFLPFHHHCFGYSANFLPGVTVQLPAMILLDSIVLIVFTVLIVILVLLPPLSRIVRRVVVLIVVAVLVVVVVLLLGIAVRLVLVVLTEALGK